MHVVTFGPSPFECRRSSRCALLTRGVEALLGVQSQVSFVHTSLLFDCAVGVIARSGGISREPPYLSCLIVLLALLLVREVYFESRRTCPVCCLIVLWRMVVGVW